MVQITDVISEKLRLPRTQPGRSNVAAFPAPSGSLAVNSCPLQNNREAGLHDSAAPWAQEGTQSHPLQPRPWGCSEFSWYLSSFQTPIFIQKSTLSFCLPAGFSSVQFLMLLVSLNVKTLCCLSPWPVTSVCFQSTKLNSRKGTFSHLSCLQDSNIPTPVSLLSFTL